MDTFWNLLGLFIVLVVIFLMVAEVKVWIKDRRDPARRPRARRRLVRRSGGSFLLLLILFLLRFPAAESLSPQMQVIKLLFCLLLCGVVFLIALWDFRAISRQMKREVREFTSDSAQELHEHLQRAIGEQASMAGGQDRLPRSSPSKEGDSGASERTPQDF